LEEKGAGNKKTAGEVSALTRVPHRPGISPALGLRAGGDDRDIILQTDYSSKESDHVVPFLGGLLDVLVPAPTTPTGPAMLPAGSKA
jgi:hypothetical protein